MARSKTAAQQGPKISLKALQWRIGELRKLVNEELFNSQKEFDTLGGDVQGHIAYKNSLRGYLKACDDVLKLVRKMPKE